MEVVAYPVFEKDFKKLPNDVKDKVTEVYHTFLKTTNKDELQKLPPMKKLTGHKNYYRFRIGDFRIGISIVENTIYLHRVLNRREMYRYFPK